MSPARQIAETQEVNLGADTIAKFTLRDTVGILIAVGCSSVIGAGVYYGVQARMDRMDAKIEAEHVRNEQQDKGTDGLVSAIGELNRNVKDLTVAVAEIKGEIKSAQKHQ